MVLDGPSIDGKMTGGRWLETTEDVRYVHNCEIVSTDPMQACEISTPSQYEQTSEGRKSVSWDAVEKIQDSLWGSIPYRGLWVESAAYWLDIDSSAALRRHRSMAIRSRWQEWVSSHRLASASESRTLGPRQPASSRSLQAPWRREQDEPTRISARQPAEDS